MISASLSGRRAGLLIPALFVATIFLSASLLFFVQPLFTRIVLPHVGGAPAVWTTAMLFFQTVLIGGYLYAHLSTRYLGTRAQMAVHLALWAAALLFLPLAVREGWRYDAEGSTVGQTLALFAAGVGLPFAVLSANAPLIQSWYARSGGPSAEDPYFLYGASNLGSLVALLAFPLLAEPLFGAQAIGIGWAAGFVALGLFLALSGLSAAPAPAPRATARAALPPAEDILRWMLLAFVPSSLMLAVTTKIATDFGSIPLVWVVPLSLYLLTFVLVFTNRPLIGAGWMRLGFLAAILVLSLVFSGLLDSHLTWGAVAALVAAFFAVALFAHRKLYEARPGGENLTLFYVTMSVGGALGGLFNSILAPALFTRLFEGPFTVAVAALVLLGGRRAARSARARRIRAAAWGLGAVAALALVSVAQQGPGGGSLFRDRSFFGTHDVRDRGALRVYMNGTTIHGAQRIADLGADRPEPLLYYHPNAPLAQVLTSARGAEARTVGVVGLGVGALACYARPGQAWHFYEIDRTVDAVARDPALFTFMSRCAPDAPTHLGDARMVLEGQDLSFDILVIDAYSSDAVPVHLTTTEAMEIYLDRLAPGGVLLYHISNRYFDIQRPLGRSAAALGLVARMQSYRGNPEADRADVGSRVVMIAREEADFGGLGADPRWQRLESDGGRIWTDDFANLLSILQ
jgi:SAM-dependent methyltransferase